MLRNLIRLVLFLPALYTVALIAIVTFIIECFHVAYGVDDNFACWKLVNKDNLRAITPFL